MNINFQENLALILIGGTQGEYEEWLKRETWMNKYVARTK